LLSYLPHLNVSLNALATLLLLLGWVLIKQKKEKAHRNTMWAAFATSSVFLVSYLIYHYFAGRRDFPKDPAVAPAVARYVYYVILGSHILLAMTVPFLAIGAIWAGMKDRRTTHRKIVKWAWPIWMYVSVTGVIVYLMLYQIYVPK
jgi:putative membrane protein